ncbi:MAG: 30S ribosomal protein S5, partial [Pseudonocardiaceae bacterium]
MPGRTRQSGGQGGPGSDRERGGGRDRRDRRDGGRGGAAQDKTPHLERVVAINRVAKVV